VLFFSILALGLHNNIMYNIKNVTYIEYCVYCNSNINITTNNYSYTIIDNMLVYYLCSLSINQLDAIKLIALNFVYELNNTYRFRHYWHKHLNKMSYHTNILFFYLYTQNKKKTIQIIIDKIANDNMVIVYRNLVQTYN